MRDDLKRMAMFGSGVAELTKHRAEQLAKELLERSKQNRSDLLRIVRDEIQNQLAGLGLANKRDVERLERRVARLEAAARESRPSTTAKKTTTRKKSTPRKATTDPKAGGE